MTKCKPTVYKCSLVLTKPADEMLSASISCAGIFVNRRETHRTFKKKRDTRRAMTS